MLSGSAGNTLLTLGVVAVTIFVLVHVTTKRGESQAAASPPSFPTQADAPNDDAAQQKAWFDAQKRLSKTHSTSNMGNFDYTIVPEIMCPTMVRVGSLGDGGKWMCNPWRMPSTCVVFSLGVGGNNGFEREMGRLLPGRCRTFSFDPNTGYAHLFSDLALSTFKPWRIAATSDRDKNIVSISDAMSELGVAYLEVLKMDIEASEYETLPQILSKFGQNPPFCQLQIEIHNNNAKVKLSEWRSLLEMISKHGFLLFFKEPNLNCPRSSGAGGRNYCTEYSFIHADCLVRMGLHGKPFHHNFPA